MRTILHVDMDAFFAAIELKRHPELEGLPVIVGGRGNPAERGVVSTANYEARKYGIHSGMPLRTAYRQCPKAVFLPVDFEHYAKVSKKIKAILRSFSKKIEDIGIDEAFLDVSDSEEKPKDIARAIKQRIYEATGLTCSVGIAPNKLLAKIASDMNKPDGLTELTLADLPRRVWPLKVEALWGVGPKTAARLARKGVATVGELAALPREALVELFGHAHGEHLHAASRGIDESPLVMRRRRKSIGHETTFQRDVTDRNLLIRALDELAAETLARLHRAQRKARTVTVTVRYSDFDTHDHSLTLPEATDDQTTIEHAAEQCLNRFKLKKPVRLGGIRLSHLEAAARR